MKILITGATGFIGREVLRQCPIGLEVWALCRDPSKIPPDLRDKAHWLTGSLTDTSTPFWQKPQAFDVVLHLAGSVLADSAAAFRRINTEASIDLARWVFKANPKVRFVYVSSLAAAGPSQPGVPHDESDPSRPVDDYGLSKLDAESQLAQMGMSLLCVRPPAVLGPGDLATLPLFQMAKRGLAFVRAGGPMEISWIAVTDLARGLWASVQAPAWPHSLYYLTHPQRITLTTLWQTLAEVSGRPVRIYSIPHVILRWVAALNHGLHRLFRVPLTMDRDKVIQLGYEAFTASASRAARDLGFTAEIELRDIIAQSWADYQKRGWL
jgi:nucleoside-diphosphate-sugar epimerase